MSKFQFPKAIFSRPVYTVLERRVGSHHLMVADAEGGGALLDLAKSDSGLMADAHVIYIPKHTGDTYSKPLAAFAPGQFYIGSSYEASVARLRRTLLGAHMGLQVYLAGTEGLMGQVQSEAAQAGISPESIQSEHRGSVARRMQCVHCKGITEDVTVDPFVCGHCGLNLYVRDHYSRRLAAFQGVCVNAEDPGNVPKAKELYT
ncbi:MAG: hypothetical protein JKX69_12950 [Rhodobacteraceae bacterium]|nr:hypothetical protein [Paracoccaceae bacterium]PHR54760.1 MAG: hypothetical protein COA47_14995 [Robiginitomaculum sp.]